VNNAVFYELLLCFLKIFLDIVIQIFGNPEILFIPINQKFDTDGGIFLPSSTRKPVNGESHMVLPFSESLGVENRRGGKPVKTVENFFRFNADGRLLRLLQINSEWGPASGP
jgi:hypothetical protein